MTEQFCKIFTSDIFQKDPSTEEVKILLQESIQSNPRGNHYKNTMAQGDRWLRMQSHNPLQDKTRPIFSSFLKWRMYSLRILQKGLHAHCIASLCAFTHVILLSHVFLCFPRTFALLPFELPVRSAGDFVCSPKGSLLGPPPQVPYPYPYPYPTRTFAEPCVPTYLYTRSPLECSLYISLTLVMKVPEHFKGSSSKSSKYSTKC